MRCPYCKAPVQEKDIFCQTCGKRLISEQPKIEKEVVNKTPKKIDNFKQIITKYKKYLTPSLIIILVLIVTNIITLTSKTKCPKCDEANQTQVNDKYVGMGDYRLGSYVFKAPKTWIFDYDNKAETIKFMDEDNKYQASVKIEKQEYSKMRGNIGEIIVNLEKDGYVINNYTEQTYNTDAVYIIDGTYKNKKFAIYYTSGGKTTIIANITFSDQLEFTAKNSEIIKTISTFKNVKNVFKES